MNASEAINRIAELLGVRFKSEKFMITKLIDNQTTITNNIDSPFSVGDVLYSIGEDSILKPCSAGTYETREGLILTCGEDSVISKIEKKEIEAIQDSPINEASTEIETQKEMLEKATLADGTEIMTDSEGKFEPGQKLYVITKEGEKVSAPEGEHTTESGIVLTVDSEGVITGVKYPDEEGEGSMDMGSYKEEMKKMKEAMEKMMTMMSSFSKDFESYKKDYEEFKNSPVHEAPIARKTFGKENIMDAKLEFLKNALRK